MPLPQSRVDLCRMCGSRKNPGIAVCSTAFLSLEDEGTLFTIVVGDKASD